MITTSPTPLVLSKSNPGTSSDAEVDVNRITVDFRTPPTKNPVALQILHNPMAPLFSASLMPFCHYCWRCAALSPPLSLACIMIPPTVPLLLIHL